MLRWAQVADGGWMTYLPLDNLIALGEARSCLAALADSTDDVDLSAHFDRLLIQFDIITGDVGHACSPVAGSRAEILARLEGAVDEVLNLGGADGLSLELLLDAAMNPVGRLDDRTP